MRLRCVQTKHSSAQAGSKTHTRKISGVTRALQFSESCNSQAGTQHLHLLALCRQQTGGKQYCISRPSLSVVAAAAAEEALAPASSGLELSGNSFPANKDIEEIQKILPHRFPFLLVDRVIELELQKYAIGYKNVTANDNFFTGHFPDRKIMPGVLQVEALAQLGGIAMMDPDKDTAEQQNFFFGGIEGCKFRRPVVPGDTLMMRVDLTKFNKRFGIAKLTAKAYVGKDLCCEAELTLVLAK